MKKGVAKNFFYNICNKDMMSIGFVMSGIWRRYYAPGVRHEVPIPSLSIPDIFDEACRLNSGRRAVIFLDTEYRFSFLKDQVDRLAAALSNLDISKGDVVAILLPNSIQFIIAYYGVLKTGATVTPVNPLSTSQEIEYQASKSGAKTIITLDIFYEKVAQAITSTKIKHIIITNIGDYLPSAKKHLGRIMGKIPSAKVPRGANIRFFREIIDKAKGSPPTPPIDIENDIASLQFTGGTTGRPKAVMLTHKNIVANIFQIVEMVNPFISEGNEVFAALLPFYHIYGQTVILGAGLIKGNTLLIFPRLELEKFIRDLSKYRVTIFPGVPTLFNMMARSPAIKQYDLSSLKLVISGADFLPHEVAKNFEDVTGKKIIQGYGLSEASPVTHLNPPDKVRANSIGVPLPSTLAGIVNPTTLEFLPVGSTGELVVSGPQVMKGYLDGERDVLFEAYGRTWLRTGDICFMDGDGYFFFVERAKDIIKHKGFTVYPAEIEDVLLGSGMVKEAAVVGIPDKDVGERIVAMVVPASGHEGEDVVEKLSRLCEEKLSEYKRPHQISLVNELPKSAVGKILRRAVRERLLT